MNPHVEFWSFGTGEDFLFPKNSRYIQLHVHLFYFFCTFLDISPHLVTLLFCSVLFWIKTAYTFIVLYHYQILDSICQLVFLHIAQVLYFFLKGLILALINLSTFTSVFTQKLHELRFKFKTCANCKITNINNCKLIQTKTKITTKTN